MSNPHSHNGVVRQAIYTSAKEEFNNYYKLLAYIEYVEQSEQTKSSTSVLTLKRLYVVGKRGDQ